MTGESEPKKYYVRFSKTEDIEKIVAFQEFSAHASVRKREARLVRQLAEDGAIVLIEDAAGNIVASSIMFPHKTKDAAGVEQIKWQEIGTTRIIMNGYPGLFDAMVSMQTLKSFLVDPPADRFVAQMHTAPVQNMAVKLGWRAYRASDELIESKFKSIDPADIPAASRDNWFSGGPEVLSVMASWMVKTVENPVLENRKTGEKIQLDFTRSSFFNMFKEEIREVAKRDLGNPDTPDYSKTVAASRDRWLKKFFR